MDIGDVEFKLMMVTMMPSVAIHTDEGSEKFKVDEGF